MVKCYTGSMWNKKFGDEITEKYKYAKKIYFDSEFADSKEQDVISKIENILDNEKIETSSEFDEFLMKNIILKFDEITDFTIRKIGYYFENGKIKIMNCCVIFLFNANGAFQDFLNEFTNKAVVNNIEMKFPEVKRKDPLREKCVDILNEILKNQNTLKLDNNELIHFFNESTVIYGDKLKFDEINTLKNAGETPFRYPNIKGILLNFVVKDSTGIQKLTDMANDINFYVGAKNNTNTIYCITLNDCDTPYVNVILTE